MSFLNSWIMLAMVAMVNQLPAILRLLYRRFKLWWSNEMQITISQEDRDWYSNSKVFSAVETYLSTRSSDDARRMKAYTNHNGHRLTLTMDDAQHIVDVFTPKVDDGGKKKDKTIKVRWTFYCRDETGTTQRGNEETKFYKLKFSARHRSVVLNQYLVYIMERSQEIEQKNRQRNLYTNTMSGHMHWTKVVFRHPATFATLALDPKKKQEIMDDLETFSKSRDYYAKLGKTWKRGYLLYGPPGSGKSTVIACMANLLDYDVYDLELTGIEDNTELRRLIVNTTSKSIIVIEDIDCSIHLSGTREIEGVNHNNEESVNEEMGQKKTVDNGQSKLTLSGLLNVVDGLWAACGGERLIVFTTNHVGKLDPALVRRGRMDVHIELGYCGFEAFKVLAKNYLEVEEHPLFEKVKELLETVKITPADVAEQLMPKKLLADDKASRRLEGLVQTLENAIKDGGKKGERDAMYQEELED
ncbi:unnamed protein product [Musa hybrid cultivar]